MTVWRLRARSMTRASPRMEQRISGQIGQPAACMIENKRVSPTRKDTVRGCRAGDAAGRPCARAVHESCAIMAHPSSASRHVQRREARSGAGLPMGSWVLAWRTCDRLRSAGAGAPRTPTDSVDNFVGKPVTGSPKPHEYLACVKTMTKQAVKNHLKSITCTKDRRLAGAASGLLRMAPGLRAVWSSRQSDSGMQPQWSKVLRGLAWRVGCAGRMLAHV